jgi:two-component system OmpR family sensor kinase
VSTGHAGAVAYLRVHDHGPGMDPAFLARATARFARADAARTTPGTGLGLAVVDAVVTAHGGSLRLCSNGVHHRSGTDDLPACEHPADGTTVTALLPRPERDVSSGSP